MNTKQSRCQAFIVGGIPCGQPATHLNPIGKFPVCEKHHGNTFTDDQGRPASRAIELKKGMRFQLNPKMKGYMEVENAGSEGPDEEVKRVLVFTKGSEQPIRLMENDPVWILFASRKTKPDAIHPFVLVSIDGEKDWKMTTAETAVEFVFGPKRRIRCYLVRHEPSDSWQLVVTEVGMGNLLLQPQSNNAVRVITIQE